MTTKQADEDDLKLLLLLRIVFEIPEKVTKKENDVSGWNTRFAGYVTMGKEQNFDGTYNFAWPIKWNEGRPFVVSGIVGKQGVNARYQAAAECEYFLKKYPYRNLATFK